MSAYFDQRIKTTVTTKIIMLTHKPTSNLPVRDRTIHRSGSPGRPPPPYSESISIFIRLIGRRAVARFQLLRYAIPGRL